MFYQPIKNELHRTLLPKLLNIFLIGHVNSPLVIRLLWHVQPNLLLEGFFEMYKKDPTSVSRILDIAQEAKVMFFSTIILSAIFILTFCFLILDRCSYFENRCTFLYS